MAVVKFINIILAAPLVLLIRVYQKTLSPDHGPLKSIFPFGFCKYYPSCSEYAKLVLLLEGIKGLPKVFNRVVACNPKSLGGIDIP